jgi:aminoglycoside phosphotransferase (APT) family kinase protein
VSARDAALAREFATDANFHALRIEPYLLATSRAHPDLGDVLRRLADRTAATHLALVHGDVSPKNILVGPTGPVLLDAECAWYGDPAFDLAFCLNHLLLKCLAAPTRHAELRDSGGRLADAYFAQADWEPRAGLEERAASLLPALLLARVDGKSPVEYLTDPGRKNFVRRLGRAMLPSPAPTIAGVLDTWHAALERRPAGAKTERESP